MATVGALSRRAESLSVTRFLNHRRTKTVIAAMDHNPQDLTKRKEGREEGRKDGCMYGWMDGWMDGWMERKQKKMPFKLNYLLDPQEKRITYIVA